MQHLIQTAKDYLDVFSALFEVVICLKQLGSEPSTGGTPTEEKGCIRVVTEAFSYRNGSDHMDQLFKHIADLPRTEVYQNGTVG
jgi:hypothetical protein